MSPAPRPLRFPQLTVACPWCKAPADQLCAGPGSGRERRDSTHDARRRAWAITGAVCPTCDVELGVPCRNPETGTPLTDDVHEARDTEAARTLPGARRPRIEVLGEQLDLTNEE